MILITTYYDSDNLYRNNEIIQCLINNNNNKHIKRIYLLNDKIYPLDFLQDDSKIIQIIVDNDNKKRLGFDYAFSFINSTLIGQKCILANSDIFFDNSLSNLEHFNLNNYFLSLSRYEDINKTQLSQAWSQDTWIFNSPCRIDKNLCKFKFGTLGCDSKLNYLAYKENYNIVNPSKTIFSFHLHASNVRTYDKEYRIDKPHIWINSSFLHEKGQLTLKTDSELILLPLKVGDSRISRPILLNTNTNTKTNTKTNTNTNLKKNAKQSKQSKQYTSPTPTSNLLIKFQRDKSRCKQMLLKK